MYGINVATPWPELHSFRVSGRRSVEQEVAGVQVGSGRTAGVVCTIGEDRKPPWLKAIAGISGTLGSASGPYPRLCAPSPCAGSPDAGPVTTSRGVRHIYGLKVKYVSPSFVFSFTAATAVYLKHQLAHPIPQTVHREKKKAWI